MKIKNRIWIYSLLLLGVLVISTPGCNNNDPTLPVIPVLTTSAVTNIGQNTATSGGTITSDGGAAVTARGVCWSTSPTPVIVDSKTTDGAGSGSFTSSVMGLTTNTTYHVRAYANNSAGTGYGNEITFTTQAGETVTDIDGNIYNTVTIGTQVWMAENLKTTKYNDGTVIPLVTDNTAWFNLTTAGYSWYNNDETTYKNTYGALYNWYTVDTGKLCPNGWHVPTQTEWETLIVYVFSDDKLREPGTAHWQNDTGATNESGFTGLPGGSRSIVGSFDNKGMRGSWWSATNQVNGGNPWEFDLLEVGMGWGGSNEVRGLSVRCVKD